MTKTKLADYLKTSAQASLATRVGINQSQVSRMATHRDHDNIYVVEQGGKIGIYHNKKLYGDEINENSNS